MSCVRSPQTALEQDTLSTVLVKPWKRWLRPDMTEQLLAGTLSLNTNKQNVLFNKCLKWINTDTKPLLIIYKCLIRVDSDINSFKPGGLFLGHWQTVYPQMKRSERGVPSEAILFD